MFKKTGYVSNRLIVLYVKFEAVGQIFGEIWWKRILPKLIIVNIAYFQIIKLRHQTTIIKLNTSGR